jgi:glyoxylase-like metal-dependent hydrolase (beta-lactamase superfamily II)/rhodanese-related sulfurtransferase
MSTRLDAQTHLSRDQWTAADLADRLAAGERPFLLDVRNEDEFAAWRIEGRSALDALNLPYFEILERGGKDEVVDSVREYFSGGGSTALPRDRTILTVCAKGGTSALVAEGLRGLGIPAINLDGGMDAWSALYIERPVVADAALTIVQVSRPARGCLSHIVASEGRAAVIDPLRHHERYLEIARERGWAIAAIIDTHAHADHVSGGPALARATRAPYFLHPFDAIHPLDMLPGRLAFEYLRDGEEIRVGAATLRVLHVPGHTLGNTALLANERYLLAGDTIFIRSIARPDLGGRGDTWAPLHFESLSRLAALPGETLVLPGHSSHPGESDARGVFGATLSRLLAENDDLRSLERGRDEFVQSVLANLPTFPPEYIEMKRVNVGLAAPDEDRIAELETGKNICGLASHT